jgi:hypothetical protein
VAIALTVILVVEVDKRVRSAAAQGREKPEEGRDST